MKVLAWFREILLRLAYPLLKWLGEIYPERSVTVDFVEATKKIIMPGDIFVTHEDMVLTNLLVPGFYTHAAIYIGNGMVMEATGIGVHHVPIEKFLYEKDCVVVLRPKFAGVKQMLAACDVAEGLAGDPYDFAFTGDNRAFYCAELVWYCYDQVFQPSPFTMRETWGVMTVTPEDFLNATDKFSEVIKYVQHG